MKKSELVANSVVRGYKATEDKVIDRIEGDNVIFANGDVKTTSNVLKNFKFIQLLNAKGEVKETKVKETKEAAGDDRITLTEVIAELIARKDLPDTLTMKKVRRVLRGDKGDELRNQSIEGFRWVWSTELQGCIEKELLHMLK